MITYGQEEGGRGDGTISTAGHGRCCCDRGGHRSTESLVEAWGAICHEVSRGATHSIPQASAAWSAPKMQPWLAVPCTEDAAGASIMMRTRSHSVVASTRQWYCRRRHHHMCGLNRVNRPIQSAQGVFNASNLEEPFRFQDDDVIFCLIVLKALKEVQYIYCMQEPNNDLSYNE